MRPERNWAAVMYESELETHEVQEFEMWMTDNDYHHDDDRPDAFEDWVRSKTKPCTSCNGHGRIQHPLNITDDGMMDCTDCDGWGWVNKEGEA